MLTKKKQETNKSQNSQTKQIQATLSGASVSILDEDAIKILASRGYGTIDDTELSLSFYEALYLQSTGMLEVNKEESPQILDFQELLHISKKADQNAWVKYLIYRDLRSRGYVVRDGFGLGIDFRVYKRGKYGKAIAPYLILTIQEGKSITVKELARVLKHVQSLKKKLVLAVVNRRGEIVYYTLSKITMKR